MRFPAGRNFVSTDKADHGSGTSLDNIARGTVLAWIRPTTSATGNQRVIDKGGMFQLRIASSDTTGDTDLEIFIDRATTALLARSPASVIVLNRWNRVGAVWDRAGAAADQRLYIGDEIAAAKEPTTYAAQQMGSGAFEDDAASVSTVGNHANGLFPLGGDVAYLGLWNRRLSVQEINNWFDNPRVTHGCVLFPDFSKGGTQRDLSPYGNHGTLTGTTPAYGPLLLRPPYRRRDIAFFPSSDQTISGVGAIASAEAFGTLSVNREILASAIASAEAFGSLSVSLEVLPGAIASAEAFGSPSVALQIVPAGIASAEAFGTTQLDQHVSVTAIGSAEAFGTPVITVAGGDQTISSVGAITSAEAFGTASLELSVAPSGIPSSEAFGTLSAQLSVSCQGIPSAEAFGTATCNLLIASPPSIASGEAFGVASLGLSVEPAGIASAEAFGTPILTGGAVVAIHYLASPENVAHVLPQDRRLGVPQQRRRAPVPAQRRRAKMD